MEQVYNNDFKQFYNDGTIIKLLSARYRNIEPLKEKYREDELDELQPFMDGANILILILYNKLYYPIFIGWVSYLMNIDKAMLVSIIRKKILDSDRRFKMRDIDIDKKLYIGRYINEKIVIELTARDIENISNEIEKLKKEFRECFYEFIDLGPFNGVFPLLDLLLIIKRSCLSAILIKKKGVIPVNEKQWYKFIIDGLIF